MMQPSDLYFTHLLVEQRCRELRRDAAADSLAGRVRRGRSGDPTKSWPRLRAAIAIASGLAVAALARGLLGA